MAERPRPSFRVRGRSPFGVRTTGHGVHHAGHRAALQGTYLDGTAMLDEGRPIVAMTLRHDRLDDFWFVLMHELAHVAKHLDEANPLFTDNLDSPDERDRKEREADDLAGEALIPQALWEKSAARASYQVKDVLALADKLGVHPAIVAGRVRHESGNFRLLARPLGHGQVGRHFA